VAVLDGSISRAVVLTMDSRERSAEGAVEPRSRLDRLGALLAGPRARRGISLALVLGATLGLFVWIRQPGDFRGYLFVGDLVLKGKHIYRDSPPLLNTWPPFFSVASVPLALMARPTPYLARGSWILLNYGLLLLIAGILARVVYGQSLSLSLSGRSLGMSFIAPGLLVPFLMTARFVLGNFGHLQVNIVIFCLTLGGLYLQANRRELLGGAAIGLAAALKVMPVVFIPYLAYRRRFRAASSAAAAMLAFSLSPVLVFGWSQFWDCAVWWWKDVARGWGIGKMNQSVLAMWDRLLGEGMLPLLTPGVNAIRRSGDPVVVAMTLLTIAAFVLLALWAVRVGSDSEPGSMAAEWSAVFIASAIFAPVTWKAYLVVLLLPNTLLYAAWRSDRLDEGSRRLAGITLWTGFILGGLTSRGIVGKTLAGRLEMTSIVTISALIVLSGILLLRRRLGERPFLV
jgi:Glycosyltransferase family 87